MMKFLIVSDQNRSDITMSSFPYVGLDEIKNDKIGTLKALFAEFIGTGILVIFEIDIIVLACRYDQHLIKFSKTGLMFTKTNILSF